MFVGWPEAPGDVDRWLGELAGERLVAVHDLRGKPVDLHALADLHRGEAVLVLVDGAALNGAALDGVGPGSLLSLAVDGDGATVVPTGGLPAEAQVRDLG